MREHKPHADHHDDGDIVHDADDNMTLFHFPFPIYLTSSPTRLSLYITIYYSTRRIRKSDQLAGRKQL
jgi:hypothetical protein